MPPFKIITADEVIGMLEARWYRWAQVHHTWKPDHSDFNGHNHLRLQQGMYNYHTNVRGWSDIGQHLTLFPDGKFVTGRDFDRNPAGIRGWNEDAFMIEHLGNFDIGHDKLEDPQLEASLKVYNYLVTHCGAEILFHREHAAKSCPGTGIDESEYKQAVMAYGGHIEHETKIAGEMIQLALYRGDDGKEVRELQKKLQRFGYYLNGEIDGSYGPKTEAAVRQFQRDHDLKVDGIAGPHTLGKLAALESDTAVFTLGGKTYQVKEID